MIVALDLDETLYPEITYVESGFRAVALALEARWGVDREAAFALMRDTLDREGRGRIFDHVVARLGLAGRQPVRELVRLYRHHHPDLALPRETREVLAALRPRPLYVVTDGHKVVQDRKVEALGLRPLVEHVFITHRYGRRHAKPSPHVFGLLVRRERATPADVVYVADDPSKDFRGIRPLGFRTIRVRTGRCAADEVPPGEDAEIEILALRELPAVVARLERERGCGPTAP